MTADTCTIRIRVHRADEEFARSAFGIEPSERHDVVTGAGDVRMLVFAATRTDLAFQTFTWHQITYDGLQEATRRYPRQLFASMGGEYGCSLEHASGTLAVPVDLDTLEVNQDALDDLREYKLLSQRVQQGFDREPPLELAPATFRFEEVGDRKPWHRLRGSISIAGVSVVAAVIRQPQPFIAGPAGIRRGRVRPTPSRPRRQAGVHLRVVGGVSARRCSGPASSSRPSSAAPSSGLLLVPPRGDEAADVESHDATRDPGRFQPPSGINPAHCRCST